MAWKETRVEEERMRFIVACLDKDSGWSMSEVCAAFGISRKTGYKWLWRYREGGVEGLLERSRARRSQAGAVSAEVVRELIAARREHAFWGPRKLLAVLRRAKPGLSWPAPSTAGEIFKRHGLVRARRQRRRGLGVVRAGLSKVERANQVWGVDYKGWFRVGDGERCDVLTVSDLYSRYLLGCRCVKQVSAACARPVLERVFREYGLPEVIRSDNGSPFASPGLGGLTRLSAWWVRLGIGLERIVPGRPAENGSHERMHRTLKWEAATPVCATVGLQQRRLERFRWEFNHQRPHQALRDAVPAEWYAASSRAYPERMPEVEYPGEFELRRVRSSGEMRWQGGLVYLSEALVGEVVGLQAVSERHWKVFFGPIELGLWDSVTRKLLAYRPIKRSRRRGHEGRAVVANSSRPTGSLRLPQPKPGTPGRE